MFKTGRNTNYFTVVPHALKSVVLNIADIFSFNLLLIFYLSSTIFEYLTTRHWFPGKLRTGIAPRFHTMYLWVVRVSQRDEKTINRLNLIDLAFSNMLAKPTRAFITIGGMAVGIGSIVFLVSLGYGAQNLVISRVARLEEMRQAEITPQTGSLVKITDQSLEQFRSVPTVEQVLPMIAVVGRITYQNSATDMAVYGVTTEYLRQSAIKPTSGEIFESDDLSVKIDEAQYKIADAIAEELVPHPELNKPIKTVQVTVEPETWLKVRQDASRNSPVIGYTKSTEPFEATEVWGETYAEAQETAVSDEAGTEYNKWISHEFPLWEQTNCTTGDAECEVGGYTVLRNEDGTQNTTTGYVAQVFLEVSDTDGAGEATNVALSSILSETATATTAADSDVQELLLEIENNKTGVTTTMALGKKAIRKAVVNRAMLSVLGLNEADALGKEFSASFIVTNDLLADVDKKLESVPATYTIIGVTPEESTPYLYVPFIDLRTLGVSNFSQVKLVVEERSSLQLVRRQIESLGYSTTSVEDTIAQIDQLFSTIRSILATLGLVALSVAALGMFNTLTVSLLERTREVGLMKAMGMRSHEVRDLFLTESMIMGFMGGFLGILLGVAAGKVLGILLSFVAVYRGAGVVNISSIPTYFVLTVFVLSISVGVLTGFYPARRATKISALNALRYE